MHIALVHLHVRPDALAAFETITRENAEQSRREPGNVRFDLLQQRDDPTRFVLVEVYRSAEDAAAHKQTPHYLKWRDTAPALLAEPRVGVQYVNLSPSDEAW